MNILTAKAGIHQHQPAPVCLYQQAVTHQMRLQAFTEAIVECAAHRAHTTTVKMVNFHRASIVSSAKVPRSARLSGVLLISMAIECREGCNNRRSGEADNLAKKPVIRQKAEG